MKRKHLIAALVGLFVFVGVQAGEVYGRVWVAEGDKKTAAAGATVTLTCGDATEPKTTDERGAYRIPNAGTGTCWIQVRHQDRPSTRIKLFVSEDGVRADLELRSEDGRWSVILK